MKRSAPPGASERAAQRFNPFERDPHASSAPPPAAMGPPPWGAGHKTLTAELEALALFVKLSAAEVRARERLAERVGEVASQLWPSARVERFGSWPAGLAAFNSDIDLRVEGGSGSAAGLKQLGARLQKEPWARELKVVASARVPIITLTDDAAVECDVTLTAGDGPRTTAFLKRIALSHAGFVPVVTCLKLLLQQRCLNKAFEGGVSSYRLCIMVATLLERAPAGEAAGALLLRCLKHFGTVLDWTKVTFLRVEAEGGGFEASFDTATWRVFDVVDALRNAHTALAVAGARLSGLLDGAALAAARKRAADDAAAAGGGTAGSGAAGGGAAGGGSVGASAEADVPAAAAWKRKGDEAIKAGDAETAFGCYTAALCHYDGAPQPAQPYAVIASNRSAAALKIDAPAQAAKDAEFATSLAPRWGKPFARLGAAHAAAGRVDPALKAYRRALAAEPNEGWQAELAGLEAQAAAVAVAAKRGFYAMPKTLPPREPAAQIKARGNAAFGAGEHAAAAGIYTRGIEDGTGKGREAAVLLSNRSAAYLGLGALSDAVADARKCTVADPSFAKGFLRLGRAHLACGEPEAAIDALEGGLELTPDDAALGAALTDAVRQTV